MQYLRNIFFVSLFVCCVLIVNAQQKELNEYFTTHQKLNQFNGNVLVAKNDKIIFQNTYNLDGINDIFRVTIQSKFIIASVSKVFIKAAILKLAEQQKLQLNDSIKKFISDFPNGEKITIEQLLLHKSGLRREISNYESYDTLSLEQIIERAKKEILLFEPNTQTSYSNVGYFLLHYIIDKLSENGYFHFIQNEVFDKLELKNTYEYNYSTNKSNLLYGFTNEKDTIEPAETKTINQFETGNIVTSIEDLFIFSQQLINGDFLNEYSREILFQNDSSLIQAGGRPGYRSYFYVNLKNKFTLILLSNQSNIPFEEIVNETINILTNKPFKLPQKTKKKEIEIPVEVLQKYAGKYSSKENNLYFDIKVINNRITVIEPDNNQTVLFAENETTFFDNPSSKDSYSFIQNEKGEITGFKISTNGVSIILVKE